MSAKQIKALRAQLAALEVKVGNATPSAGPSKKRRRRKVNPGKPRAVMAPDAGSMRFKRLEHVDTLTGQAFKNYVLDPTSFTFMARLGSIFDRVMWHSVVFKWKPTVGMNNDGAVALAFDWDSREALKDRNALYALTPVVSGAVWKEHSLSLPPAKIMAKKWYSVGEDWPGICWVDLTKGGGELWVSYDVTFMGTK